jgi:hypothetical protein
MKPILVPVKQAGRIVLPKHIPRELTGFVRKGKALVFSTAGNATLSEEIVREILENGREDHDSHSVDGLSLQNVSN